MAVDRSVEVAVPKVLVHHGWIDAVGMDCELSGVDHFEGYRLGRFGGQDVAVVNEADGGFAVIYPDVTPNHLGGGRAAPERQAG